MARSKWRHTGQDRPAIARAPREGQRSVWDFPRPPILEEVAAEVRVRAGDLEIARSRRALRVLETGAPPTYYVPGADVERDLLVATKQRTRCEWKGEAAYWDLAAGPERRPRVAWSYDAPFPGFEELCDHFAFYPGRVACFVGGAQAMPQPGDYYGGWITPELVGPFKGEPGTEDL